MIANPEHTAQKIKVVPLGGCEVKATTAPVFLFYHCVWQRDETKPRGGKIKRTKLMSNLILFDFEVISFWIKAPHAS